MADGDSTAASTSIGFPVDSALDDDVAASAAIRCFFEGFSLNLTANDCKSECIADIIIVLL
jgi:hypothetical protein